MIFPKTSYYFAALTRPHRSYTRVEVYRSGILLSTLDAANETTRNLRRVFLDGSLRATLQSRVTRTLSLTVPAELYPTEPADLLSPYGHHLKVFWGIRFGDGSVEEFPVFNGPILSVSLGRDTAEVSAADLASEIVRSGFAAPHGAREGHLVLSEFENLVSDALPAATFGTHDDLWEKVPLLSYDHDRAAALDKLAETASAFWYTLADGSFVIRRIPWTQGASASAVWQDGPDGTIINAVPQRSGDGVYNRITVTSERQDGSEPIYYTADDEDPTSPTYVGGPFGIKAKQIRVASANTEGQAKSVADAFLRWSRARTEAWAVETVPDASVELGDVVRIRAGGREVVQVVAGFGFPLLPGGSMSVDMRAQVPGSAEDNG